MVTINTAKATPADGFLDIPLEFIMVMMLITTLF